MSKTSNVPDHWAIYPIVIIVFIALKVRFTCQKQLEGLTQACHKGVSCRVAHPKGVQSLTHETLLATTRVQKQSIPMATLLPGIIIKNKDTQVTVVKCFHRMLTCYLTTTENVSYALGTCPGSHLQNGHLNTSPHLQGIGGIHGHSARVPTRV